MLNHSNMGARGVGVKAHRGKRITFRIQVKYACSNIKDKHETVEMEM